METSQQRTADPAEDSTLDLETRTEHADEYQNPQSTYSRANNSEWTEALKRAFPDYFQSNRGG